MIFNPEMTERLRELNEAAEGANSFLTERHFAFGSMPERVVVTIGIVSPQRKFALPLDIARGMAAQLHENGHPEAAMALEAACR